MTRPIDPEQKNRLPRRLGWLVLIWTCSVAALGLAAFVMRLIMRLVGMST